MDEEDQPPYSMIGAATTLQTRSRKKTRPIGFIWPSAARKKTAPSRRPPKRGRY